MNNREAAYEHFMRHEMRISSAYSDVFYAGFDAALASQAQQPALSNIKTAEEQFSEWLSHTDKSVSAGTYGTSKMNEFRAKEIKELRALLQSQAQQEPVTPERNMLRQPTVNLSTCFVGGIINRDTPEVAIGKINKELEKSIAEYFNAQQNENHKAKIKAWCNTLEKAADNFERQGYSGESADLLDIKAYIQPLPPAPEGDKHDTKY